jgi:hypothetical protein
MPAIVAMFIKIQFVSYRGNSLFALRKEWCTYCRDRVTLFLAVVRHVQIHCVDRFLVVLILALNILNAKV